jgi:transposase
LTRDVKSPFDIYNIETQKAMKQLNFNEFNKIYPTDKECMDEIFDRVFGDLKVCPDCEKETKWHLLKGRKCYSCQWCGHLVSPLAKTPLSNTKISIRLWFFAFYLFGTSKHGVSAKELESKLGVSYPTAWRMGHVIREMMNEEGEIILSGDVEMDETLVGGKKKGGKRGWGADKPCVFGMVERGGNIVTKVVKNREGQTLLPIIVMQTTEDTVAHTDDFSVYKKLKGEVSAHHVVRHTEGKHVDGPDGHWHTQTIDGHWSILKRSIRSTHTSV